MSKLMSRRTQVILAAGAAIITTALANSKMEELERKEKEGVSTQQPSEKSSSVEEAAAAGITLKTKRTYAPRHDFPVGEGFQDGSSFLDDHTDSWDVQTSMFNPKYMNSLKTPHSHAKKLAVEVLRNSVSYGATTPMRIIGYLPNVTPDVAATYICDRNLRLKWDKNYSMFALMQDDHPGVIGAKSCESVKKRSLLCILPAQQEVIDSVLNGKGNQWTWGCHRVVNSLLEKLGVRGRFFQYERLRWSPQPDCHLIVYRSIADTISSYPPIVEDNTPVPSTNKKTMMKNNALMANRDANKALHNKIMDHVNVFFTRHRSNNDETVFMHHQTIALLPVKCASSSTGNLERLLVEARNAPSATSQEFARLIDTNTQRNSLAEATSSENDGNKNKNGNITGTLMIMTSLNDTVIPSTIPKWAEKRIAHFFTAQAYDMLYHTILEDMKLQQT